MKDEYSVGEVFFWKKWGGSQEKLPNHDLFLTLHEGKTNDGLLTKLAFAFLEEKNKEGFFQILPLLEYPSTTFSGFVEKHRPDRFGSREHNFYDVLDTHLILEKEKQKKILLSGSIHDIKHEYPLKSLEVYYEALLDSKLHPSVSDVCLFAEHKDLLRHYFVFLHKKNHLTEAMIEYLRSPVFNIREAHSFVKEWVSCGGDVRWQNEQKESWGHLVFAPVGRDVLMRISLLQAFLDHGLEHTGPAWKGKSVLELMQLSLKESKLSPHSLPKEQKETWEKLQAHVLKTDITASLTDCIGKRNTIPKKRM